MVAKSTYVWLAQLSRAYGVRVGRLDEVPEAALAALRDDGFNALWLIGVWERSRASRNLKRARGQADAGASAYSLYDYVVAEDLGGEQALAELSRRAAAAGLRLASDMVPNHTGLDSRWLVDHPERFVQLPEPPFPGYSFTGPDLAGGGAVEVRVEDHYYDGSDAAVVFERRDRATGRSATSTTATTGRPCRGTTRRNSTICAPTCARPSCGRSRRWRGGSRSSASTRP